MLRTQPITKGHNFCNDGHMINNNNTDHNCGCVGQVSRDGGEVEGGDGADKSLEGSVTHQVEGLLRLLTDWLIVEQFLGKVAVEPEEINHLGGRVNFSLKYRSVRISVGYGYNQREFK